MAVVVRSPVHGVVRSPVHAPNANPWGSAAVPLALTQKGYGYALGTGADPYDLALGYGTVSDGEAPVAGDFVVWIAYASDNAGTPFNDLSSSGWEFSGKEYDTITGIFVAAYAKVLEAADLSSPPEAATGALTGVIGFWVAYSVASTITTVTLAGLDANWGGAAAPADVTVDASAAAGPLVLIGLGGGNDDAVTHTWTGATEDFELTLNNPDTGDAVTTDFSLKAKAYTVEETGDSVTLSKGDDGANNILSGFYVTVS